MPAVSEQATAAAVLAFALLSFLSCPPAVSVGG
jgi:hypothetical protein